jgi:hypothetical protein
MGRIEIINSRPAPHRDILCSSPAHSSLPAMLTPVLICSLLLLLVATEDKPDASPPAR